MSDEQMTKTVNVNGNSFHVEIAGTGMPLVLIMGLGAPGEKWNKNIKVYRAVYQFRQPWHRTFQQAKGGGVFHFGHGRRCCWHHETH